MFNLTVTLQMLDKTNDLNEISKRIRIETIKLHLRAPATRIASSLSSVEIFVSLYYGGLLKFDAEMPDWEGRDRLIVSKGHGSICLYPILADLGYFPKKELENAGSKGSFLGGIPDPDIPGYETINGSLGHGLGIATGSAIFLKSSSQGDELKKVFVVISDGELYEGSTWEAIMLAGAKQLNNLCVIIDNNNTSMLDRTQNIIPLENISDRLALFGWETRNVDGHNANEIVNALKVPLQRKAPFALVANTVKGKGVSILEEDPLSHIANLSEEVGLAAIKQLETGATAGNSPNFKQLSNKEKLFKSEY